MMLNKTVTNITKTYFRIFLFILSVSFLLYGQTIAFDHSDLDDRILIEENFKQLESISDLGNLFTQSVFSIRPNDDDNYYRPLLMATFMLDSKIGGRSLEAFHISNILMHALASFLLVIFLTKLRYRRDLSFSLALIFLCHPAFTTAVAWIPGRNDSLFALFFLGALIKQIDYHKNPNLSNILSHHLLFIACLFTKETAIGLPILFFLFNILLSKDKLLAQNNKPPAKDVKKNMSILFFLGWGISITIYLFLRQHALGNANTINLKELVLLFTNYSPTIVQYIGKLLFPFNLSTYPIMEDTTILLGLLSLVAIVVFIHLKRENNSRYYWMGLAWLILLLLPVAIIKENALEHRLYVPALGFSIMCLESKFIHSIRFDKGRGRWIIISILLLFSFLTFRNSKNYENEISFWSKALQTSPHSPKAHFQMGCYDQIAGRNEEAEKKYKTAIDLNPEMADIRNNLGKIYISRKQFDTAEELLLQELSIKPGSVTYYNLATICEEKQEMDKAKQLLRKAIELNPRYADALIDLGILLAREKKFDEALELCFKTLEADPSNKLAYKNITLIYLVKKQFSEAKTYYQQGKNIGVILDLPFLDTLSISTPEKIVQENK